MFEQARIGSSINYILRVRGATGGLFHHTAVERFFRPLLPAYAKMMKQNGLSSDEVAVELITETIAKIEFHDILMLEVDNKELLEGLAQLYAACALLRSNRPDKFAARFHEPDPAVAGWLSRVAG